MNSEFKNTDKTIVVAGANGQLGHQITYYLANRGAFVRALVRKGCRAGSVNALRDMGVFISEVDYNDPKDLVSVCTGSDCVVSALSGLHDVIVETQKILLNAAIQAGVPRFIPSDFCIDYTKLPKGNRNLDLRREFARLINLSPIAATSILNGMFADLLIGQAPIIIFKWKKIIYWGSADQLMDFTTIANTAEYTAAAALDDNTPRYLRIAGEVANMRSLQRTATEATGSTFKVVRLGGLGAFGTMIKFVKTIAPQKNAVFPPWQGMRYMYDMFGGLPKLNPLDNDRYPGIKWATIRDVLSKK